MDVVDLKSTGEIMAKKEEQVKELTETLQRLQAEFENYKKRTEGEKQQMMSKASKNLVLKLLPIVDNIELALKNTKEKTEFEKGIEMIYAQLIQTLNEEGVEIIETLGTKFDPSKHEALMTEESKEEPNTIIEELQKGYTMNGEVIRHSKVKVSK